MVEYIVYRLGGLLEADDKLSVMGLSSAGELPPEDMELYNCASTVLRKFGVEGRHSVGAAVRTRSGKLYAALDLRSRKSAICAEPGAISAAHSAGDYDIEAIIDVCRSRDGSRLIPISPCGSCRELIHYHQPECRVLFEYDGSVVNVKAAELFRFPLIQV